MSEGIIHVTDSRTSLKYEIPVQRNTIKAADFRALKAPHAGTDPADQVSEGIHLLDPGFKNTATSDDGRKGIVQYRGYNLAEFWKTAEFEDLSYLLVWGHWPSSAEKETFRKELVTAAQNIPDSVSKVIQSFPRSAAPMQMVIAGLAAYLGEDPKSIPAFSGRNLYNKNLPVVDKAVVRALACFQVCAALAACHRSGISFTSADADQSFLYNLLLMMGKVDKATGKPDPTFLYHIQRVWALGADLGHTNSTSALLLGASSLSDPLSCLISALSSGYGILHFGAAEASYKSLAAIGKKENVPYMIVKVKRGEEKLFGYGHRIFNTIDPRIPFGAQILGDINSNHPLIEVAMEIDRIAGKDEYFVSRNLQANSDLFIGIVYTALDFDPSFVPVMIALMRSGGMMAHWREAMSQPINLWRPQQLYTGKVGLFPQDVPGSTATDWSNGTRANGDVETLLASSNTETAVNLSQTEPVVHETQALITDAVTQPQHSSIPGPALSPQSIASSATVSASISQHTAIPSIAEDTIKPSHPEPVSFDIQLPQASETTADPKPCNSSSFGLEEPPLEDTLPAKKTGSRTPIPIFPPSAPMPASSAFFNNDGSKRPRVVTLEIQASPASHARTTVPINDATLFFLGA